jgi:hypothetical protein
MPVYHVDASQYFDGHFDLSDTSPQALLRNKNVLLCQPTIKNLIARYGLAGKSILSLGAGEGHEEHTFHSAGCRLTLNDVNPAFEPYLKRLPAVGLDHSRLLTYSNEDAAEFVRRCPEGTFDLLYVSSFHPDEVRREQIQSTFAGKGQRSVFYSGVTWPKGEKPYLDILVEAFRTVRPGGLIMFQHYRGGVDISFNSHYLESVRKQFAEHRTALLEAYCFRQAPSVLLNVAFKGDEKAARVFGETIRRNPEIFSFHGRFHDQGIKGQVTKVFDLVQPQISVATAFPKTSVRSVLLRARHILRWRFRVTA